MAHKGIGEKLKHKIIWKRHIPNRCSKLQKDLVALGGVRYNIDFQRKVFSNFKKNIVITSIIRSSFPNRKGVSTACKFSDGKLFTKSKTHDAEMIPSGISLNRILILN
jgi:hypothetical protein